MFVVISSWLISSCRKNAKRFCGLETNAEREHFIEQFWARRNPTPGAAENLLKREHYRRIAFALLNFPTCEGTPGWKTDRVFGPPNERDQHSDGDATRPYPWERWKYRWIEGIGDNVSMEFVDIARSGDYRMTTDPNPGTGQQHTRPQPNPRLTSSAGPLLRSWLESGPRPKTAVLSGMETYQTV